MLYDDVFVQVALD